MIFIYKQLADLQVGDYQTIAWVTGTPGEIRESDRPYRHFTKVEISGDVVTVDFDMVGESQRGHRNITWPNHTYVWATFDYVIFEEEEIT